MPEQYLALVVILFISFFSFHFSRKVIEAQTSPGQFKKWSRAWLSLTVIAFLANNFWIFIVLTATYIWFTKKDQDNKLAFFLAILLTVPMIKQNIPIVGLDKLIAINYPRLLSLVILFPAYLALRKMPDTKKFGSNKPDKLLIAYMILTILLLLRRTTFTDMLRDLIYAFTDVFLPYYVASRGLKNLSQLKEALVALCLAGIICGAIGSFEYSRHWLLYAKLADILNVDWDLGGYLNRGSDLRAIASLGHPLVLGFVMMITFGLYLFISASIKNRPLIILGLGIVLAGLFSSLSRGPWLGCLALTAIFIATGPKAIKRLFLMAMIMLMFLPALTVIPGGHKILHILPFTGDIDMENVDYRKDLLENSIIVFQKNPLLGSEDFSTDLADLGMTQGEGIVDIVNSYLEILLHYGLIGLSLFVAFFMLILFSVFKSMRRISDKEKLSYQLGRVIFSCLIAILITIFSISSILIIPILYWTLAGLGVGYVNLVNNYKVDENEFNSDKKDNNFTSYPTSRLGITAAE